MDILTTLLSHHQLWLLALGFAIILTYKCLSRIKNRTCLPPRPNSYTIIGCLPRMIMNKATAQWMHKVKQVMDTKIACFRLGNTHVIPVTSLELVREFLRKHDAIFATRPSAMSVRLISDGYLTTIFAVDIDQWMKMRRVLSSEVLSSSMHKKLHDKRSEEANHVVRYIYNQCKAHWKKGLWVF